MQLHYSCQQDNMFLARELNLKTYTFPYNAAVVIDVILNT